MLARYPMLVTYCFIVIYISTSIALADVPLSVDVTNPPTLDTSDPLYPLVAATPSSGTDDDGQAIEDIIEYVNREGGGVVYLPAGEYTLDTPILLRSLVTVKGAGQTSTTLKAKSVSSSLLDVTFAEDIAVEDLTVDAVNSTEHTGGGGIRIAGGTNIRVQRVTVKNTFGYGLAFQATGGAYENVILRDVTVEDPGSEGIDFKNPTNINKNIVLENITVSNPDAITDSDKSPGVDIRGTVSLSNITVTSIKTAMGIRFRQGETGSSGGLGGHESTLRGFHISGDTTTQYDSVGIQVNARNVRISQGIIKNVRIGLSVPCHDALYGEACDDEGAVNPPAVTDSLVYDVLVDQVSFFGNSEEDAAIGFYIQAPKVSLSQIQAVVADAATGQLPKVVYIAGTGIAASITDLVSEGGYAAVFVEGPDARVSGCEIDDTTFGFYVKDSGARIANCAIEGASYGVYIATGSNHAKTTVSNVTVRGGINAFEVYDTDNDVGEGSDDIQFIGCRAESASTYGFKVSGDYVSIIGSSASGMSATGAYGIRFTTNSGTPENGLIDGCTLHDNKTAIAGSGYTAGTNVVVAPPP